MTGRVADALGARTIEDIPANAYRAVLDHAVAAIENGDYHDRPYPLVTFHDFLPRDFYRGLLSNMPDADNFVRINKTGSRREFSLFDPSANPGAPSLPENWTLAAAILRAPELEAALRRRLEAGLAIRAGASGEAWPIEADARPVIYADHDGYFIKPHPDTRRKVITMQLYLPEDADRAHLGTTIYKVSAKGLLFPKRFGLAEVRTLPFAPNFGYAFAVIHPRHSFFRASWHGRKEISVDDGQPRFSILNAYYARHATR